MIEFRHVDLSKDQDRLLELYKICFPARRLDKRWLHWYISSPYGTRIFVLSEGETFVAAAGFYTVKLFERGSVRDAGLVGSVCVHPDYRGQGNFMGMMDALSRSAGSDLIVVPNNAGYKGYIESGGREYLKLERWEKLNCQRQHVKCEQVAVFDNGLLDRFLKQRWGFKILKDAKFLNWRTVTHPIYWYENYVLPGGQGFIIMKHWNEGDNRTHIIDLEFLTEGNLVSLLKIAENFAAMKGAPLDLWLTDPGLKTFFDAVGFAKKDEKSLVVYSNIEPITEPSWFCYADNDLH